MISILIPIHNRKITELVDRLSSQCKSLGILYEIHCFDDQSRDLYKIHNRSLDGIFNVNYVELSENLGRSKIRNRLAKIARYDLLLFLDGDTGIIKRDFIKKYLKYSEDYEVINGGRNYQKSPPKTESKRLHWLYGSTKEYRSADTRNKYPNQYFHSNNFLIRRELMLNHLFDESLIGYGYEDLVFACSLGSKGIVIKHIDNETRHLDLITAKNFIQNTENSLENLWRFYQSKNIEKTNLLRYYEFLVSFKLKMPFIKFYELLLLKKTKSNLISSSPNISLLQLYKLYYFCKLTC